jgi:ferritin-like metal-binding protein YciE
MAIDSPGRLIKSYLEDAIAAEKNFETQLRAFAKEGDDDTVHAIFEQHADETRDQYQRLTSRLEALGSGTSGLKTALAHMLGMLPKAAQLGHDESERVTQNLIMAFTVENAEVAMYEALAAVAEAGGDVITAELARSIQQEEERTAELVWSQIPHAAIRPLMKSSFEQGDASTGNATTDDLRRAS